MATSESSVSTSPLPHSSPKKETTVSIGSKIAELSESRSELLGRIQGLKQDLQSWRSKLDTQVKVYRDELQELKKSLNSEVDVLRTEFQDLRNTLQQQQNDVEASLRNMGLQDVSVVDIGQTGDSSVEGNSSVEENELPNENGKEAVDSTSQTVDKL